MITGYDPGTDSIEHSGDVYWTQDVPAVHITRRVGDARLKVVMPESALTDPWPEEFLWRPLKALGVLDVWWSMYRAPEHEPRRVECVYQTADAFQFTQQVPRELVDDAEAWRQFQRYQFQRFLCGWQEALDDLSESGTT